MSATKGERLLRYQNLYQNYSRLGLSLPKDRPIAIDGLQRRLLKAFDTEGDFGIFDEGPQGGHLRRSLLWRRGYDVPEMPGLVPIESPLDSGHTTVVPSWSWMAYIGGIDYLDLEFNGVDWMELHSPWTRQGWENSQSVIPRQPGERLYLGGISRDFDELKSKKGESLLVYDRPVEKAVHKCVILGKKRGIAAPGSRLNYVLLVAPTDSEANQWRRIGAGYLPERCVDAAKSFITIV
jgi:hypothetical protein